LYVFNRSFSFQAVLWSRSKSVIPNYGSGLGSGLGSSLFIKNSKKFQKKFNIYNILWFNIPTVSDKIFFQFQFQKIVQVGSVIRSIIWIWGSGSERNIYGSRTLLSGYITTQYSPLILTTISFARSFTSSIKFLRYSIKCWSLTVPRRLFIPALQ
jgi:hypothetical protein